MSLRRWLVGYPLVPAIESKGIGPSIDELAIVGRVGWNLLPDFQQVGGIRAKSGTGIELSDRGLPVLLCRELGIGGIDGLGNPIDSFRGGGLDVWLQPCLSFLIALGGSFCVVVCVVRGTRRPTKWRPACLWGWSASARSGPCRVCRRIGRSAAGTIPSLRAWPRPFPRLPAFYGVTSPGPRSIALNPIPIS